MTRTNHNTAPFVPLSELKDQLQPGTLVETCSEFWNVYMELQHPLELIVVVPASLKDADPLYYFSDAEGKRVCLHQTNGSENVRIWFDGRPADWIKCRDGKTRPVEPGTFPLAHGIPGRVGTLRGYGNAIVPQVAAEVIGAYMAYAEAPCAN